MQPAGSVSIDSGVTLPAGLFSPGVVNVKTVRKLPSWNKLAERVSRNCHKVKEPDYEFS